MQETIVDKKPNDDTKSTLVKFEKTSVKSHDTYLQTSTSNNSIKSSSIVDGSIADGDSLVVTKESKQFAMVEIKSTEKINASEKNDIENEKSKNKDTVHDNDDIVDNEHQKTATSTVSNDEILAKTELVETEIKKTKKITETSPRDKNHGSMNETDKPLNEKKNGVAHSTTPPPPPVMRGTMFLDLNSRRHCIRGMWNYENSTTNSAQRFELARNLDPDEDETKLPADGVFHGSFSLAYIHITSKGKQKERSKVVFENGVQIKFTLNPEKGGEYKIDGKGTNTFGVFNIYGSATPSGIEGDPTLNIIFRKRYEPVVVPVAAVVDAGVPAVKSSVADESAKLKNGNTVNNSKVAAPTSAVSADQEIVVEPLPEPTKSFASGVICLRGTLYKEESHDIGISEVVHRINGMWAAGLDIILADPQNVQGLCNRFEYEHKSSSASSQQFPVSGRYSGWFELSNEDATRTRINERDVTLKFRLNSAGYHNIEGKGSNVFGKYTITGTLTLDNVLTIFREFLPRRLKPKQASTNQVVPSEIVRRPSFGTANDAKLKLDDVVINREGSEDSNEPFAPIVAPVTGTYSAVSQGVLRLNDDGSHSCQGKWAVTREHFQNSITSNFNFRLEAHHAQEAVKIIANNENRQFPLDSAMYKGSFQMKKQGSRKETIVDQQIVMKFRKNTQGSYNIYGVGLNPFGEFTLLGTLVMSGKTGGQVELYRMYKDGTAANTLSSTTEAEKDSFSDLQIFKPDQTSSTFLSFSENTVPTGNLTDRGTLVRRESSRVSKMPSRLEEDDPSAQLSRIMEMSNSILKFIREKDIELGAYFSEPVDPIALGIPTYFQVIKEPMDLGTVQQKMESDEVSRPEEFMRLVRLVFENAMTFNIDPTHSVHKAARSLLVRFNEKVRDVERIVQSIRRTHGIDEDGKGKRKNKEEKKRKRHSEETKATKRQRLEDVQTINDSNTRALAAIDEAAPASLNAGVTRFEFNMLLDVVKQMQKQAGQVHLLLADLLSNESNDGIGEDRAASPQNASSDRQAKSSQSQLKSAQGLTSTASVDRKNAKRKPEAPKQSEQIFREEEPSKLTEEEQTWLGEAIIALHPDLLDEVIGIIRESSVVLNEADDALEIEIDQLDPRTQRKLMKYVLKHAKKAKPKPKKKPKQQLPKEEPPRKAPEKPPSPKKQKTEADFFSFNRKDGSDSDSSSSDEEGEIPTHAQKNEVTKGFDLGTGLGDMHDDNDDDEGDLTGNVGTWMESFPSGQLDKKDTDTDKGWGADAREQAAAVKAKDAERKAREEKMKKEAEEASQKAMAEAAKRKEEALAKQAEEKQKEASLLEQQELEAAKAREAAREKARVDAQSLEQSFDLDEQREIMRAFDNSFVDNDSMAGASPSSDFGF